MSRPRRRRVLANLRYLVALLSRFKSTLAMALALFGLAPLMFLWRYPHATGQPLRYGEAFHHVYFLLFGNPSLLYVDDLPLETLNLLIPPLGLAVVVNGILRIAYLYFARHRAEKEWITLITQSLEGHVIVCGAGRIGYRVATQLLDLGHDLVVLEKRADAPFVSALRDRKVIVSVDDINDPQAIHRANVKKASAIVGATNDDLANLNVALDARKANPNIRVVLRLFDDDLAARVKETFGAETTSSSALAAPVMALAALDPRIEHSFQVAGKLMVVSRFRAAAPLSALTVSELRDRFGGFTLALSRTGAPELHHPEGKTRILAADLLTVQAGYEDYLRLRAYTGEETPPVH